MKFKDWFAIFSLLALGVLFWSLREILILIFAGIVIATALCKLTSQTKNLINFPRSICLLICITALVILISIFSVIVIPQFSSELQQLINQLPNAAKELWNISSDSINNITEIIYGSDSNQVIQERLFVSGFNLLPDAPSLATGVGDGIKRLLGLAGNLGSGFIQIIFVLAVGIMLAAQPKAYQDVTIKLIPQFYRKRAKSVLLLCGEALSNWMAGLLISSFFVSLLAGIGLSLLGIKLVIANALLAGILNIIPNVGPVISTIFPMSVALLDEPWKALAVLGLYIIIQNLESYLITPSVMHYQVKLLPGLTLIAQLCFTVLFGPMGLLLALPLAVIFQVIIKEIVVHDLLDNLKMKRILR